MFYVYTLTKGWLVTDHGDGGSEWSYDFSDAVEYDSAKKAELAGERATSCTLYIFQLMPTS